MKKNNVTDALLSVSAVLVVAKIAGFIKQIIIAKAFGANIQTDIISLSQGIISDLDYIIVQALITSFIPIYIGLKSHSNDELTEFVSDSFLSILISVSLISLFVIFLSNYVAKLIAPSYSESISALLSKYIKICSPGLVIVTLMAFFNALLKSNECFVPGELIGFNQSIILILFVIVLAETVGPDSLIIGYYGYCITNLLFLSIVSRKYWRIQKGHVLKNKNVHALFNNMGPLILGYSMVFVNQQVDKIIVTSLGEGIVTSMSYAAVLSNFIGTFTGSLCGVLFTYITSDIVNERSKEAAIIIEESSYQLITILIPICILTFINSYDIVYVVFGRGKFNELAIENCSKALKGYCLMFVPFVVRELFSRLHYAYNDTRTPMKNSSISIVCNIVLSILLSRIWGVFGVTLASSFSVLICAILNYYSSKRKNDQIRMNYVMNGIVRWVLGIMLCVFISYIGQIYLATFSRIIRITTIILFSMLFYFLICFPIVKPLIKRIIK